jgi:F0F1-type ATP synthase membrane subunit b/b'
MKARNRGWITGAVALGVAFAPAFACAAEGAKEGGRSWFALILYVINAGIFVAICVKWGGPMVAAYFRDRARSIIETIARSRKALQDAEKLAHEAAELIARLEDEKKELIAGIERETAYQVSTIRDAARHAAERVKSDIEATMAAAAENARRRMRIRLAETAGSVARDLVGKSVNDDDQHRTIRRFITKLAEEAPR